MTNYRWHIALLTTGGTIEKTYDEGDGSLSNRDSFVGQIIKEQLRLPDTKVDIIPLMNKDSLDMNDADRRVIVEAALQYQEMSPVVILHGTDTMAVTGQVLAKTIPNPKNPIILTGAMRPLGIFGSDGTQNLTEALLHAKFHNPGCFISFHGQLFDSDKAKKNIQLRSFSSK